MTKVVVLTDTTDYKLPPAVEASYNTAVQAAIATGVQNAIAGSGDTATAVANAVTAMTTAGILKNANVLPSAAKNLITGWFHCDGYGAIGDGVTDSRGGLQGALTAAGAAYQASGSVQRVYLPSGVYIVSSTNYLNDDGSAGGAVSLMLPSGVDFFGPGVIKVKANAYGAGALYGAIRSKSGGITRSKIRDITIDGNRANQTASQQCSNILLNTLDDIEISHVKSINANGNGMLLTGTNATPTTNVRVTDNFVSNASMIGIQVSQFSILTIARNTVGDCTNNGIDVYGERGSNVTNGDGFTIVDNIVYQCAVGIFPETVSLGLIQGNNCINNAESGIHVNRVNGVLRTISIIGNQCTGGPYGIFVTGDMFPGAIRIRNNVIDGVTGAGIQLGGGGSNVSYVYIIDNSIDTATVNTAALVAIAGGTPTWSQSMIRRTTTKNTNRSLDVYNLAVSTASTVSYDQANQ